MLRRPLIAAGCLLASIASTEAGGQTSETLASVAPYTTIVPGHEDVARTIGLVPLGQLKIAVGWREVRVWVSSPGLKSHMVRVVQGPDTIFGELFEWWSGAGSPAGSDARCQSGEYRGIRLVGPDSIAAPMGLDVCTIAVPEADWGAFLQGLDQVEARDLPSIQQLSWDEDENVQVTRGVDGSSVVGETLDGEMYHVFYWWEPEAEAGAHPAAAREIIEQVLSLVRTALSTGAPSPTDARRLTTGPRLRAPEAPFVPKPALTV